MTTVATASSVSCPVCAASETEPLTIAYDRVNPSAGRFSYVTCTTCGLARQDPLPGREEIASFYPEDYAPHAGARRKKKERTINRLAKRYYYSTESVERSPAARLAFRAVSNHVMRGTRPPRGGNRLLDVGCGSGDHLARYRDLGWTVAGIEISERGAATARSKGLEVHRGTVYDAPFPKGAFDLVTLNHVIEHVTDPKDVLAACARFLAPEGLLVVSTPNLHGLGFSFYRSCWYHLDAPRHVVLFEPRTLRRLARVAGLEVRRLVTRSDTRALCSSRRYARTQGADLPEEVEARRELIARTAEADGRQPVFRRLAGPLSSLGALLGRGEIIEAELAAR